MGISYCLVADGLNSWPWQDHVMMGEINSLPPPTTTRHTKKAMNPATWAQAKILPDSGASMGSMLVRFV